MMKHTQPKSDNSVPTQTPKTLKKKKYADKVELASDDSFPCSDPPGWIRVHATPVEEEDELDMVDAEKDRNKCGCGDKVTDRI